MADGKALETGADADHASHSENASPERRGLVRPPALEAMTAEQRADLERELVRKIDLRLLPMIILMYILNYIDRYVCSLGLSATIHCAEDWMRGEFD